MSEPGADPVPEPEPQWTEVKAPDVRDLWVELYQKDRRIKELEDELFLYRAEAELSEEE